MTDQNENLLLYLAALRVMRGAMIALPPFVDYGKPEPGETPYTRLAKQQKEREAKSQQ